MKTKQQINLEILALKSKIEVEKNKQSNLWGTLVNIAKRADYQTTIKTLQWVLSDIHEPLTIQLNEQQTQLKNDYNS